MSDGLKRIEDRLAKLEERQGRIEEGQARIIEILRERVLIVREDGVDETALDRAIRELAKGNRKPLSNYIKRGGKIPKPGKPGRKVQNHGRHC